MAVLCPVLLLTLGDELDVRRDNGGANQLAMHMLNRSTGVYTTVLENDGVGNRGVFVSAKKALLERMQAELPFLRGQLRKAFNMAG